MRCNSMFDAVKFNAKYVTINNTGNRRSEAKSQSQTLYSNQKQKVQSINDIGFCCLKLRSGIKGNLVRSFVRHFIFDAGNWRFKENLK